MALNNLEAIKAYYSLNLAFSGTFFVWVAWFLTGLLHKLTLPLQACLKDYCLEIIKNYNFPRILSASSTVVMPLIIFITASCIIATNPAFLAAVLI